MLYILTGIGFFLFCIRIVFFWTALWQSNGYDIKGLGAMWRVDGKKGYGTHSIGLIFLFFATFLYGVVITNENITPLYHFFIGLLFMVLGGIFLWEVQRDTFVRPVFTLRSLTILLSTVFFVAVLYMIPLVDSYVWLVLLTIALPLILASFVALLAFPAEIYIDYLSQKALEKLRANKSLLIIAVTGEEGRSTKKYLQTVLAPSYHVATTRYNGIADILQAIRKDVRRDTDIFIFEIQEKNKNVIDKISLFMKVDVLIATSSPSTTGEGILSLLARQSLVVSFMKNVALNVLIRKRGKKLVLYGTQKNFRGLSVKLITSGKKILLGNESFPLSKNTDTIAVLPIFYIARKLGISAHSIRQRIESK